jgi:hypothetical protein
MSDAYRKSNFSIIKKIKQKKINPRITENLTKFGINQHQYETLCSELYKTYDVSLIDNLPDDLIEKFRSELANCLKIFRPVLTRLIINYYNNKKPELLLPALRKPVTKFIRGPRTLTIQSSEFFNMRVCIFGESHKPGNCLTHNSTDPNYMMDIEDYLEMLLKNTDKYLDYIFEVPTMGRGNRQYQGPITHGSTHLNSIFQKFRTCIETISRGTNDCTLGRVHFMDIRTENLQQSDAISYFWMYIYKASTSKIKTAEILNNKTFISLLHHFYKHGCNSQKKLVSYFNAFIFGNTYNVIQLRRLMESKSPIDIQVGNKIIDYIKGEISLMVSMYFDNVKFHVTNIISTRKKIAGHKYWINIPPLDRSNLIKSFKYLAGYITRLVSLGPDLYTLCRMFRTFNLEKPAFNGAIKEDQPKKAINIVIYSGDAHSQRYRRFLRHLNFKEDGKTGQSSYSANPPNFECIDMTDIKQPFFSDKFNTKMYVEPTRRYEFDYNFRWDDFTIT